jgi:excisionase family DNA binding protein
MWRALDAFDGQLTQKEVCQLLRISPKKLQLLRRDRKIKYLKYGHRSIRFRQQDVAEYIRKQTR